MILDIILVGCCITLGILVGRYLSSEFDLLKMRIDYLEQKTELLEEALKKNGDFLVKQSKDLEEILKELGTFLVACNELKEQK